MSSQTAAPIIIEACPTADISVLAVRLIHPSDAENCSRRARPITESPIVDSTYTSTSDNSTAFDNSSSDRSKYSKDVFRKPSELGARSRSTLSSNESCRDLIIAVLQHEGAQNGYTMDEIHSQIKNNAAKEDILNILVNDMAFQARKTKHGCRWVLNEVFLAKTRIKRNQKYKRKLNKIAKLERKIAKLERERETVLKRRQRLDQKERNRTKKLAKIEHSLACLESDLYNETSLTRSIADGGASVESKRKDPDNSWCTTM